MSTIIASCGSSLSGFMLRDHITSCVTSSSSPSSSPHHHLPHHEASVRDMRRVQPPETIVPAPSAAPVCDKHSSPVIAPATYIDGTAVTSLDSSAGVGDVMKDIEFVLAELQVMMSDIRSVVGQIDVVSDIIEQHCDVGDSDSNNDVHSLAHTQEVHRDVVQLSAITEDLYSQSRIQEKCASSIYAHCTQLIASVLKAGKNPALQLMKRRDKSYDSSSPSAAVHGQGLSTTVASQLGVRDTGRHVATECDASVMGNDVYQTIDAARNDTNCEQLYSSVYGASLEEGSDILSAVNRAWLNYASRKCDVKATEPTATQHEGAVSRDKSIDSPSSSLDSSSCEGLSEEFRGRDDCGNEHEALATVDKCCVCVGGDGREATLYKDMPASIKRKCFATGRMLNNPDQCVVQRPHSHIRASEDAHACSSYSGGSGGREPRATAWVEDTVSEDEEDDCCPCHCDVTAVVAASGRGMSYCGVYERQFELNVELEYDDDLIAYCGVDDAEELSYYNG